MPCCFKGQHNHADVQSDSISITVLGCPQAWQRPKVGAGRSSLSGSPTLRQYHAYNPCAPQQKDFIKAMKLTIGTQSVPPALFDQPCAFTASFCFPRPKHHLCANGAIKEQHLSQLILCHKADVDNLVKFVLDCAQGIIISDDYRVCRISAEKRWSQIVFPSPCNQGFVGMEHVSFQFCLLQHISMASSPMLCPYQHTEYISSEGEAEADAQGPSQPQYHTL